MSVRRMLSSRSGSSAVSRLASSRVLTPFASSSRRRISPNPLRVLVVAAMWRSKLPHHATGVNSGAKVFTAFRAGQRCFKLCPWWLPVAKPHLARCSSRHLNPPTSRSDSSLAGSAVRIRPSRNDVRSAAISSTRSDRARRRRERSPPSSASRLTILIACIPRSGSLGRQLSSFLPSNNSSSNCVS